mmetsp:Transcript_8845/g.21532  ORF Transcript_8845/g.21532 Transcript_8845/m.21532 type:complete len:88 (-) Transcript_8845:1388-1651(-)
MTQQLPIAAARGERSRGLWRDVGDQAKRDWRRRWTLDVREEPTPVTRSPSTSPLPNSVPAYNDLHSEWRPPVQTNIVNVKMKSNKSP